MVNFSSIKALEIFMIYGALKPKPSSLNLFSPNKNIDSGYFEYAKISMIKGEKELIPTGIIFVSGEVPSNSIPGISKLNKLNLGKIWKQKREQARKRLQGILEKQK